MLVKDLLLIFFKRLKKYMLCMHQVLIAAHVFQNGTTRHPLQTIPQQEIVKAS
jgi:hypothetical protein